MGFTNYLRDKLLNHTFRNTAYSQVATVYSALFSVKPTDAYTGGVPTGTELTGGNYARTATTYGAPAAGTPGRKISNSGDVTFPTANANWSEAVAQGVMEGSGGAAEMLAWEWLTDATPVWAAGTAAVSDTFTSYAHGFSTNDRVILKAPLGAQLPTGVSADTVYYVISAATDTFSLSLTQGGGAIDITAVGEFLALRIKPVTVNSGDTAKFTAGQLFVQMG